MKERAEKMKVTDEIIYVGVNDHDIDLLRGSILFRLEWLIILM